MLAAHHPTAGTPRAELALREAELALADKDSALVPDFPSSFPCDFPMKEPEPEAAGMADTAAVARYIAPVRCIGPEDGTGPKDCMGPEHCIAVAGLGRRILLRRVLLLLRGILRLIVLVLRVLGMRLRLPPGLLRSRRWRRHHSPAGRALRRRTSRGLLISRSLAWRRRRVHIGSDRQRFFGLLFGRRATRTIVVRRRNLTTTFRTYPREHV